MDASANIMPANLRLTNPYVLAKSLGLFIGSFTIYGIYVAIYNLFFHPAKHIPGPLFARMTPIPYIYHVRAGSIVSWLEALHKKYGHAVRLAPNEVSFSSGDTAWPDIYGFRTGKHKDVGVYSKDKSWLAEPPNGVQHLINADEVTHTRMRRTLAHAFSDKSLREQEPLLQEYADLLVERLSQYATDGKSTDIVRWYNFFTFDIISELSFSESLFCLRDNKQHIWINLIYGAIKAGSSIALRQKYAVIRWYERVTNVFKDNQASHRLRMEFYAKCSDKVGRRLNTDTPKPDFFSSILKHNGVEGKGLSRGEMDSNSVLLLIAGSETTATTLSAATYLILRHPEIYAKVVDEIRSAFSSYEDITLDAVNNLRYTIACFSEALRLHPPVPTGFPRIAPPKGGVVSGVYVPEGMTVYVSQHSVSHTEYNFKDCDKYVPERWLGDEKYKDDKRDAVQPFSFGPRSCLGRNLAYAEMRLGFAKILFKYDLELVDPDSRWLEQKVFTLWNKPELLIRINPVKH
ncbi:cytochrome P450 monooxygenase-like protein [Curvularia clavata]|uniref:Cytochrome P450 monooxygenase-like protein n=1 Tax=Curvularia clavata TaxID=95742 RepID=A0A9Q8Z6A7_CURCL|nr:cytochrome P450 monooxygenase-like protein [Curvularia clavata]